MKKFVFPIYLLILGIAFFSTSCGGTLIDPEYRIVNLWSVSHAYCNGVEVDSTTFDTDDPYYQAYMPSTLYYIYADHVLNVHLIYHGLIRQSTFGTWVVNKSEKTLKLEFVVLGRQYSFLADIIKMSRREMILEFDDDNGHWRLELYAQTNY